MNEKNSRSGFEKKHIILESEDDIKSENFNADAFLDGLNFKDDEETNPVDQGYTLLGSDSD